MREPFGPYTLLERIAVGGMGELFLAKLVREEGFEKLVVVKRMLPHLGRNPTFVAMFQTEARLAAQLTHQNIVQIHDFGKIEQTHYIAMEAVHGIDLRALEERGVERGVPLPLGLALEIAAEVAAGLDYAHRKHGLDGAPLGLVHRDVSPQNVLVSYEGEVKLTDFGLAKARLQAAESEAGTLKGKYSYVSPEQLDGRPVDGRSDIFSLGVVLFELCAGERLFPLGESFAATLDHIRRFDGQELHARTAHFPPPVRACLEGALAPRTEDRFATAAVLGESLRAAREAVLRDEPTPTLAEHVRGLFAQEVRTTRATVEATVVSPRPMRGDSPAGVSATLLAAPGAGTGTPSSASALVPPAGDVGAQVRRRTRYPALLAGAATVLAGALTLAYWLLAEPPAALGTTTRGSEVAPAQVAAAVPRASATGEVTPAREPPPAKAARPTVTARAPGIAEARAEEGDDVPADEAAPAAQGTPPANRRGRGHLRDASRPLPARVPASEPASAQNALSAPAPSPEVAAPPASTEAAVPVATDGGAAAERSKVDGVVVELWTEPGRRILRERRPVDARPARWRLTAGAHLLSIVDDAGLTETRLLLRVGAGAPRSLSLNLDARPWAQVSLDGQPAAHVPLSNRRLALGAHTVELRRSGEPAERLRLRLSAPP